VESVVIPGFYWLIVDELAGCSRPGGRGRQRSGMNVPDGPDLAKSAELDRDLAWIRGLGIRAVLSLTETQLDQEALARHGLASLHLPVPDMQAPTPEQIMRALGFIDRQRSAGRAVVVHCLVGQGRTGTILAAYRIRAGATPEEALRQVRAVCPGAVESSAQQEALRHFAARRDWIL
jgi:hypothetical protein